MKKMGKIWALAWLLSTACSDDDDTLFARDASAATAADSFTADTGTGNGGSIDASFDARAPDATPEAADAAPNAAADASAAGIEVAGTWNSNFGGTETIDASKFGYGILVQYDNALRYAITQNAADDMFAPSKFSKVVWTPIKDGVFYYCTVDYGLLTAADAVASIKVADATDPLNSGCDGFGWTQLSKP